MALISRHGRSGNPLSVSRLFHHPSGARLVKLHQARVNAGCRPRTFRWISVAVAQFRGSGRALKARSPRTIEDGVVRRRKACGTFRSSITAASSVDHDPFALETTPTGAQRRKDAVTRVRANLPQNVNEPLISASPHVIGLPIVTYARDPPGNTAGGNCPISFSFRRRRSQTALQGVRGVSQVERNRRVGAKSWSRSIPTGCQAAGLPPHVARACRGTNSHGRRPRRIVRTTRRSGDAGRRQTFERSRRHHDPACSRRRWLLD